MKRTFLPMLAMAMCMTACQQKQTELKVKVAEGQDKPHVLTALMTGDTLSAQVKMLPDSSIMFTTAAADTLMGVLRTNDGKTWVVVLDGEPIEVDFTAEKPKLLKGSALNQRIMKIHDDLAGINAEEEALQNEYGTLMEKHNGLVPEAALKELYDRSDKLQEKQKDYYEKSIKDNKDNILPVYLMARAGYMLDLDFADEFLKDYAYKDYSGLDVIYRAIKGEKNKKKGAQLVDLEMKDIHGDTHKLSDYVGKGNYTLVDFWASWCSPCRREMPNVKACYEKYVPKGFQVVGISFDSDQAAWEKGVADLGITWPQLSELNGWDNQASKLYHIAAIPAVILYDPSGKVVDTDLHGEKLGEKLEELLGAGKDAR